MKFKNKLSELSLNASLGAFKALSAIGLGFVAGECLADGTGVNHLAGLKGDVHATFGAGSDVEYILFVAEGLSVAYMFHKTKSYATFAALPALMAFTHYALK
ncbi:MAG: conjugal transfer protein TraA [Legionella sp.]|nr:MAG: conjugal transfer protein TraA [Legionella sp.]